MYFRLCDLAKYSGKLLQGNFFIEIYKRYRRTGIFKRSARTIEESEAKWKEPTDCTKSDSNYFVMSTSRESLQFKFLPRASSCLLFKIKTGI